ncbi:MAG: DNA repair protein RecN [Limnochordia bacterium]|jgi:DNA repair protein RecN (Recombination protein N)
MLRELHIRNYALIERLDCQFMPGLNILTGETGAGKSIIIDAVCTVLGGRATVESIKGGEDSALVEACFEVEPDSAVGRLCTDLGYPPEDGLLILTREVNSSGRHRCRLNGRVVPLHVLADVGQALVDVHGQHDHQSLLRSETHGDFLDAFIGEDAFSLRRELEARLGEYRQIADRLAKWKSIQARRASDRELLAHQVNEIEQACLRIGEDEQLEQEKRVLQNASALYEGVMGTYEILYRNQLSATSLLGRGAATLGNLVRMDKSLTALWESLQSTQIVVQEIARELRTYGEGIEARPGRLDEIEERLELINHLKRKYGRTIDDIIAKGAEMAAALELEEKQVGEHKELQARYGILQRELKGLAAELSELRKSCAARLEEAVQRELEELNMPRVRFQVAFLPNDSGTPLGDGLRITLRGTEHIEFLIAPNPGEEPRPLIRIASGGEMSRIMLALKTILAKGDNISTLIFDEVDAGIGGQTADKVAIRLARLARDRQVLVVTHLAQVASMADSHYRVQKEEINGTTKVNLARLQEDEPVEELARMLGGNEVTARQHAQELLNRAGRIKQLAG